MTNMVKLDDCIVSEINAIAKYSNREKVNIEALILMVGELFNNLQGQRPCIDGVENLNKELNRQQLVFDDIKEKRKSNE